LEAGRQQAAAQAAAQQDAARTDAERQASAAQATAQQEAARQDSARQQASEAQAARLEAARAAAAQREARLQALGRQLNEEADQRKAAEAARQASNLPSSWSSARRGRIFGRSDVNAELVLYAEAWSRKIELNMTFDAVRSAAQQPHSDPVVLVAVRSDGSVESVSFVRSSGLAALDEAIRGVVQSQANYPAFQPALASQFDVVEIRRTWHFDGAIRLY
jgi:TonB family protein